MKQTHKEMPTSLETAVYLALQQCASRLQEQVMERLKPHQLSTSQYNILRILRGAGDKGCTCSEIAERMISKDPDITRLLDRLVSRELITRTRCDVDRRVVKSYIDKKGLAILNELDAPIEELHQAQFHVLSEAQQQQLLKLLKRLD